jgi:uncharacterized membrane protein YfcA
MSTSYLLAALATFASVFLKGFQHKNVIANKMASIVITSYFMACADVWLVGLIVRDGWVLIPYCGTGAAIGMYISIKLHDRLFGK